MAASALDILVLCERAFRGGFVDVAASADIGVALATASTSTWIGVDRALRDRPVRPTSAQRLRLSSSMWALLSMTRDGRVRGDAIAFLQAAGDRVALTALLLRSDDVVFTVRSAADLAVTALLPRQSPATLVALLPLVDALRQRVRARFMPALKAWRARCADVVDFAAAVDAADHHEERDVHCALLRLWAEGADVDVANVVARAVDAGLVDVVLGLVRSGGAAAHAAAPHLATSTSTRLRVRAAQLLRAHLQELAPTGPTRATWHSAQVTLMALAIDPRSDVRGAARLALGPDSFDEQRAWARDVVDAAAVDVGAGRALVGALGALAEIGRVDDLMRIARFLHDARVRVAAEAVRAVVGTHAGGDLVAVVDVLLDHLRAPSWRVAVEAARGFLTYPAEHLPKDALLAASEGAHPAVARVLRPLVSPGGWSC